MGSVTKQAEKLRKDIEAGKMDPVSAQLKAWDLMLTGLAEGDRLSRKLTLRKNQEKKAKEVFERWYEGDKEWAERCGRTDPKGLARNAHFTGFFDGIEYRKDVSIVDEIIAYAKEKESQFKESAILFFKDRHKGNYDYCYRKLKEYKIASQIWYSVWRYIEIKYN